MTTSLLAMPTRPGRTPETCRCCHDRELLVGVHDRAKSVLALLAARAWPGAELHTLTSFLRVSVLQESCGDAATIPVNDREILQTLVERLDTAEPAACPRPQLRRMVEELLRLLDHHTSSRRTLCHGAPMF